MVQGLAALAVHDPDRQAVDDGYLLPRHADAMIAEAESSDIPA